MGSQAAERDDHLLARDKQVSFEEGNESSSSDDGDAVEVSFDPSNPYRRKSSLVTSSRSDISPDVIRRIEEQQQEQSRRRKQQQQQKRRRSAEKPECIVHQFLESHKIGLESAGDMAPTEEEEVEVEDVASSSGLNEVVDAKTVVQGSKPPRAHPTVPSQEQQETQQKKCQLLSREEDEEEEATDEGEAQPDQNMWQREMLAMPRTTSSLSLTTATTANENDQVEVLNSRLLTKKQLSDMAWGVRQLSRRLGSVRLKFRVRHVFVLTKVGDGDLVGKTRELVRWLLDGRARGVRYVVFVDGKLEGDKRFDKEGLVREVVGTEKEEEEEEEEREVRGRLRFWNEEMCRRRPSMFDFVVTLGGDGTVLYASWLFQRIVPPVLSFALGSLGFLTKFDFESYEEILGSAFEEGVTVSLRLRFEGTVMRSVPRRKAITEDGEGVDGGGEDGERDLVEELIGEEKDDERTHRPDGTWEVLNELVVDRGPNATMSNIEIFGDDEHFTSVSADGVCVSTPTGSTAYNLAAGGSLCHPENPVMLVTPICAHTLSFRPIILPDTIVLRIGVPFDARTSSWASFDGRERVELRPGDYVTISASRFPFACVQPRRPHGRRSGDWINSISAKLGWNTRQARQKPMKGWEAS
ncbi:ATP-NAD kinase-like domain-containing protein [Triangularia verruculosa]|uniref:ATP-NAD kinase-like domain-containing protein n=1 Tax=Triangularia verruculosa TaxID=2587418 RepID=A0AAN7AP87_9PEZI|nr:ATP-NAD kinase-like domain-containing protein [Triangularia verruculosa]